MLPENSNNIALRAQADIERFYSRVVVPTLAGLEPEPAPAGGVTDDIDVFLDAARVGTHNALCAEARIAFALTLGAAFERHLRSWLAQATPSDRRLIQKETGWANLATRASGICGTDIAGLEVAVDIEELWLVVSAIRHGDGRASQTLLGKCPHLWAHLSEDRLREAISDGVATFNMQVTDADLSRYAHAILALWGYLGATPMGGGRRGFYVPMWSSYQNGKG